MKKLIIGVSAAALLGACAVTSEPANYEAAQTQPDVAPASAAEIERLNDLVSVYIDAEALYTEAAELPDNQPMVREELAKLAEERSKQREYLQARVAKLGGEPDTAGEALGTTHRVFTEMRTVFSEDSEAAIEEVLRGERYIVEEISEFMTTSPTEDTVELLVILRDDAEIHIEELEKLDRIA
ncbi:MAG: hypothetical protein CMK09_11285 [Ponticaulis sp.]|nr:hypothetical protein [Ponticaulis sp.]|tara:strand:+ start:1775 stop:2323 length:549 start_codon:yes stop_codon:yes gene_type:complete